MSLRRKYISKRKIKDWKGEIMTEWWKIKQKQELMYGG